MRRVHLTGCGGGTVQIYVSGTSGQFIPSWSREWGACPFTLPGWWGGGSPFPGNEERPLPWLREEGTSGQLLLLLMLTLQTGQEEQPRPNVVREEEEEEQEEQGRPWGGSILHLPDTVLYLLGALYNNWRVRISFLLHYVSWINGCASNLQRDNFKTFKVVSLKIGCTTIYPWNIM